MNIRIRLWSYALIVAVVAIAFNGWILCENHFFFADDWGWLERAQFGKWSDLFHLLPQSIYNDRPGGEVFIRIMYKMFWLDVEPYNVLWLAIHTINCILVYVIALMSLPPVRSLAVAILAACWFSTLTAVLWVGAIFDLAGALWCLLALLCYLKAAVGTGSTRSFILAAAAVLFHVLAIRTKEFSLALIVVLAAWDMLVLHRRSWRERAARLLPHLIVTLVYCVAYLRLYELNKAFVRSGAYQLSLSFDSILHGVGYYFAQAFYAFNPSANTVDIQIGYIFLVLMMVVAALSRTGVAAMISAAALSAAVLALSNQHAPLYLYAPHFFMALVFCSAFQKNKFVTVLVTLSVALLLAWPVYTGYLHDARHFVLFNGRYSRTLFYDYARAMHNQPIPSKVTVVVSEPYFDPFSWGPGNALQIYYADRDLKVDVIKKSDSSRDVCASATGVCFVESGGHLVRRE